MSEVAVICASCPEGIQDRVTQICQAHKIQKAYGKSGDMVDSLKGKDWVAKWQSKVVAASVTKAVTMSTSRIKLICIQGGKFCNEEFAHTKTLKSAIEQEWKDGGNTGKALIEIQWMDMEVFFQDYTLSSKSNGKEDRKVAADNSSKSNKSSGSKGPGAASDTRTAGKSGEKGPHGPAPTSAPAAVKGQTHHAEKNSDKHAANEGKKGPPINTAYSSKKGRVEDASEHKGSGGTHTSNNKRETPADKAKPGSAKEKEKEKEKVKAIEFSCDECDKEFKNKESLAQHLSSTNHYTLQMMCKGCQKTFKDRLGLKQHQQATGHYGVGKEKIRERTVEAEVHICGECEREFLSEKAWEAHQEATGHSDPECSVCAKVFSSPRALEQHLEATAHGSIGAHPFAMQLLTDYYAQVRLAAEAEHDTKQRQPREARTAHGAPARETPPEPVSETVPPAKQPSPSSPVIVPPEPVLDPEPPVSVPPAPLPAESASEIRAPQPVFATPAPVFAVAVDAPAPPVVVAEPVPAPPAKETAVETAVRAVPVSVAKAPPPAPAVPPAPLAPTPAPFVDGPCKCSSSFMFPHRKSKCAFGAK